MKTTLVLLTLAGAAVCANSQGTVAFTTRNTANGVNALIYYTNYIGQGPVANGAKPSATVDIVSGGYHWGGTNAFAGLYGGPNGTSRDGLVLLVPAVGFRTGAAAGYVNSGSDTTRVLAGVPGGALATIQVRAWDCGTPVFTYEDAMLIRQTRLIYIGESPLLNNVTLGNYIPPVGPPTLPAALTGLEGFAIAYIAPEPSVIGLGILGAIASLLVFRLRQ